MNKTQTNGHLIQEILCSETLQLDFARCSNCPYGGRSETRYAGGHLSLQVDSLVATSAVSLRSVFALRNRGGTLQKCFARVETIITSASGDVIAVSFTQPAKTSLSIGKASQFGRSICFEEVQMETCCKSLSLE